MNERARSPYKVAESYLYRHREYQRRIEALEDELKYLDLYASSVGAQQYDAIPQAGGQYADKVAARMERKDEVMRELARLKLRTTPVVKLQEDLQKARGEIDQTMNEVLQLQYLDGVDAGYVKNSLSRCKSSYYDVKRRLVRMAASYLGLGGEQVVS